MSTDLESSGEVTDNLEKDRNSFPTIFILQRHGAYDNSIPKPDDSEEVKQKAGWLTPEGVDATRTSVRVKIDQLLLLNQPLDFFFLHSPTTWEDAKGNQYGRRAEQTSEVAVEELVNVIKDRDLIPDRVRILEVGKTMKGTRVEYHLVEPNIFFLPKAEYPRAYINAMIQKYGVAGRWEGYHNKEEDLEEIRKKTGAESAADIAKRLLFTIRAVDRWSQTYGVKQQDRLLVVWMSSHNDSLRALMQHGFEVGKQAYNYSPVVNEILELSLDQDKNLSTEFKGQQYTITI